MQQAASPAGQLDLSTWVRQAAAGDEQAMGRLYDATSGWVYGFALAALGSSGAAESVVLDVYVELWRTAQSYNPARTVSAWLQHIAVRLVAAEVKAERHRGIASASASAPGPAPLSPTPAVIPVA